MKQITLARRQHRAVALFAALQCWIRGLDGVCLQRSHLERLTGSKKYEKGRKEWLETDFKELFQSVHLIPRKHDPSVFSLFVSRVSLEPFLNKGDMSDEERIASIRCKGGPQIEIFQLWDQSFITSWGNLRKSFAALMPIVNLPGNYDERLLTAYMSLISTGQMSFRSLLESLPKPHNE